HVLEPIEERALLVIVDRFIRDGQDVVDSERREWSIGLPRRLLEALELLEHLQLRGEPGRLPAERLADESARAGCALVAVVDRAREIEGGLRAGHGDIGETAFLGDITLAVRRLRPGEGVREPQGG